jgi:hypothetical protein
VAKSKKKKGKKKSGSVEQVIGMDMEGIIQRVRLETLQAIVARVTQDDISYEGAVKEVIQDIEAGTNVVTDNVWVPKVEPDYNSMTVSKLAEAVGKHPNTVRKFLGENFPNSTPIPGYYWNISPEMVNAVVGRWG